MAYKVRAGDLRHRITIKQLVNTTNTNGFPVEQPGTTICECWAAARDMSVSKSYDAATQTFSSVTEFTVYLRSGINEGMCVFFDGETYRITHVNHGDYKSEFMVLATTRMERVSG